MGTLYYGSQGTPIEINDRALAHVKMVIVSKLRRGEAFTLSFQHEDGSGRSAIWLSSAIPLRFTFEEVQRPELNARWLEELAESANLLGGITLVPERTDDGGTTLVPETKAS
ncbi:hypothetical protein B5M43_012350 [Microbacterium sp. MEC084]|uniref:DUF7882 family protein n=1 Tax=unclassified Microbacterium TaxID=2609290 RepID=UPI0006FE34F3|nr:MULTISPECIES: hypothetical protein [unclassified Microbacterium]KQY96812.1 hypothetical protein ASD19_09685 [Microbacterium sp. Root53]MCD1269615.1 hypothetical protein [Microbacterium sp. MEC084]